MFSFGVLELLIIAVGIAFYGFLLWLAWTLVMSVKGIRDEVSLMRQELRKLLEVKGV